MVFLRKSWIDFRAYSQTERGKAQLVDIYRVVKLTNRSALEVMRMPADEFEVNRIVANVGVSEERYAFFETLSSLISQFLNAIFGKK